MAWANPGIAIAQGVDGDTRNTVEVGMAFGVIERAAFTPLDDKRGPAIDAQDILLFQADYFLGIDLRAHPGSLFRVTAEI